MDKAVTEYTELFTSALTENQLPERVYAVIPMCLELKTYEPALSGNEIIAFVNGIFEKKRGFLRVMGKCAGLLPNSFQIAQKRRG